MSSIDTEPFNEEFPWETENFRSLSGENFLNGSGLRPVSLFNVLLNNVFFSFNISSSS